MICFKLRPTSGFLVLIYFTIIIGLFTRVSGQNFEDVIPKSIQNPDIAALNRFIDFPINRFNGTVDVSIPIYQIELNGLSIPIYLKYHTGGIKVSQEASSVGLGWALDAGSYVNKEVRGEDDTEGYLNVYGKYFPYQDSELLEYTEDVTGQVTNGKFVYNADGERENILREIYGYDSQQPVKNTEPDLFRYKLGNFSGTFSFDYDANEVDLSNNHVKFKYHYLPGRITGDSIVAQTPDGCTYKLKNKETGFSISGIIPAGEVDSYTTPRANTYYVSEIITPAGERVTYEYASFAEIVQGNSWENEYEGFENWLGSAGGHFPNVFSTIQEHTQITATQNVPSPGGGMDCYSTGHVYPPESWEDNARRTYNFTKQLYITKIRFPAGVVEFSYAPREDFYGLRLEQVIVKDLRDEQVRKVDFQYGYFNASYNNMPSNFNQGYYFSYPDEFYTKRLKLLSFYENDDETLKHSFRYNKEKLPSKATYARDFWGYYNGALGNRSLIPSPGYKMFNPPTSYSSERYGGAYLNVDTVKNQACILEEIQFPTGGKTKFTFESNVVNNFAIVYEGDQYHDRYYDVSDMSAGTEYEYFELTKDIEGDIFISLFNDARIKPTSEPPLAGSFYVSLEKYSEPDAEYRTWYNGDTYYLWDLRFAEGDAMHTQANNVLLTAGKYRLVANFPDTRSDGGLASNMASINFTYKVRNNEISSDPNVGGLRIREIEHIAHNEDAQEKPEVLRTSYTYEEGILATYPVYGYDYTSIHRVPTAGCGAVACYDPVSDNLIENGYTQYLSKRKFTASSSFINSSSAGGSLVGYKKVIEKEGDGSNGTAEYNYHMRSDKTMIGAWSVTPGTGTTPYLDNGLLASMDIKDKEGNVVRSQQYSYMVHDPSVYWVLSKFSFFNETGSVVDCSRNYAWLNTGFYPLIRGKAVQTEVKNIEYAEGREFVSTTSKEYGLDALAYPTKITQIRSDEYTNVKTFIYPINYLDQEDLTVSQKMACEILKEENRMVPLQESLYLDEEWLSTKRINYHIWYTSSGLLNFVAPISVATRYKGQDGFDEEVKILAYHEMNGRPTVVSKKGGGMTYYIWGYNYQQLIGVIEAPRTKGVDFYATILNLIGESNLTTLGSMPSESQVKSTFSALRNASDLADCYVTSYTYKPLVGITSATDPNGQVTNYEFDQHNRLYNVSDNERSVLKYYQYNYQH